MEGTGRVILEMQADQGITRDLREHVVGKKAGYVGQARVSSGITSATFCWQKGFQLTAPPLPNLLAMQSASGVFFLLNSQHLKLCNSAVTGFHWVRHQEVARGSPRWTGNPEFAFQDSPLLGWLGRCYLPHCQEDGCVCEWEQCCFVRPLWRAVHLWEQ